MVTKKEFTDIINRLRDYNNLRKKINHLFKDCIDNEENCFRNAGSVCIGHESVVVKLLENMFDTDLIGWWLYECDYGKRFRLGNIQKDGVNINLTTPEKLYDYLVKELEK